MNILICDSHENFVQLIENCLKEFFMNRQIPYNVKSYLSCEALLADNNKEQIDLLFLDTQVNTVNGIEFARKLRSKNKDFLLIFVSNSVDSALDGYEVKTFRYILKDQLKSQFSDLMDVVLLELEVRREKKTLSKTPLSGRITTSDIYYIESRLHTIYIHFKDCEDIIHFSGTLDHTQGNLPENQFVRIHKSYLVNLEYLEEIRNRRAYLSDGQDLPVSQQKYIEARKKFQLWRNR